MTAPVWDPSRYLHYAEHRRRAALDLLARIDVTRPAAVHDLGCGPGNVTRMLRHRWPDAHIVASDNSPAMLQRAASTDLDVEWRRLDAAAWDEPARYDVIYSNAVLHWIPSHDDLIVRLLASLRPGGALAVQMPLSWYEPSHELIRTVLQERQLGSTARRSWYATPNVASPEHYANLLDGHAAALDLWTTRYFQVLRGPDPVLEWVSGTALRPLLDDLPPAQLADFLEDYSARLHTAYPPRRDGTTLFPFPRLFFVATV